MRPKGPKSFLLDGRTGWRTASSDGVSVSARGGLRLDADPAGPLALTSQDDSLGGLVLPARVALDDEGTFYILGRELAGVRRFDPEWREFVALAAVGAEQGSDVRQFRDASAIAVAGHSLYVADRGNRRVQVFALGTLAVRHVFGPLDARGRRTRADDPDAWEPVDVAARGGLAHILDRRRARVYTHRPGTDTLRLLIDERNARGLWSRVAVDTEGLVYLLDAGKRRLRVYDAGGRFKETLTDAGDVRESFEPPPLRLSGDGEKEPWRFCLPEGLMRACDRRAPCDPPAAESPLGACASKPPGGLVFDREGRRVRLPAERHAGPRLYAAKGEWLSEALDSEIYRCQWHRVELGVGALPAGTRLEVYTYTDAQKLTDDEVRARPESLWSKSHEAAGRLARPPRAKPKGGAVREPCADEPTGVPHEFLVQSHEGQFLWLKIRLTGDGYGTPSVKSARIHYPRQSYLAYLPAVYSSDEETRHFLERFLSIFQTEWDELERRIDDSAALFDPKAVPADEDSLALFNAKAVPGGKALEWLASWFALPLEGTWKSEQKRRLLEAAAGIYFGRWKVSGANDECLSEVEPSSAARRGTAEGLRRFLRVYLENITGLSHEQQGEYPQVVEGFRERQRMTLGCGDGAALSVGAPLWSQSAVGRLRLGEFAREGETRLVSTGDPERDLFHEFAHRFRVFVPSAWVRTARDEEMVRRALNAEKPAHTSFDLCLVEPRFRVGLQSTVGIDTVVGAHPRARLACRHDADTPPSRPPAGRLGYDMILAAQAADRPTLRVGRGTRAGLGTVLT
ncbi:MAG TPA: hypothetical protein VEX60_02050 [Pyrinomonadaceae bacterium]|nr:hypothetical protein [Pyrinomonadaceae bacterium]